MRKDYRFDEALEVYSLLAKTSEPGAEEFVKSTHNLIYECTLERKRLKSDAQKTGELAQECLKRNEFQRAGDLLAAVPARLLTEDLRKLWERSRQGLAEVWRLKETLEAARDAPLSTDLLRKLGHFLDLCPEDQSSRDLAVRLRKEIAQAAEKYLAQCQYEKAVKIIAQVPATLLNESLNDLRGRAQELSWLAWDLRRSPAADPTLQRLISRFRSLAPHDHKTAEICRTLELRLAKYTQEKSAGLLPWAAPPERTILGPPVEWIKSVERIHTAANGDIAIYQAYPGRFIVACGLALQGLDRGAIRCNFLKTKSSLLKRLFSWKTPRHAAAAWGIDLGSHALKVVKLRTEDNNTRVVLEAAMCIEHTKPLSQTANENEYKTIIEESFHKLFSQYNLENEYVCLGLSAVHFFFGQFELPIRDPAKIASVVEFKAKHLFPVPLGNLIWDYIDLSVPDLQQQDTPLRKITVVGAKSSLLNSRLKIIAEAGLKPDLAQCDAVALYNFAAFNFFPQAAEPEASQLESEAPLALMDFGGDMMNFVACAPGMFWLRNFSIGSDRLNRLLVRQFKLTFTQAEHWKREPAAAPDIGKLWDVLRDGFADIGQSVAEAADAYQKAFPNLPLRRYLVVGGGSLVHGLLRYLWFER